MRQAVTSASSWSILVTRPISATILALAVVVFFVPFAGRLAIRNRRAAAPKTNSASVGT